MLIDCNYLRALAGACAFSALSAAGFSATAEVNGVFAPPTSFDTLSNAVAFVQAQGAGPHTVDVTVDSLPGADSQIVITTGPLTINGDADGNGTRCDILVDVASIQLAGTLDLGLGGKAYLELNSASDVIINDLQIHPNADGDATSADTRVDAVRAFKPDLGTGNYELNNLRISGSDSSDAYVALDTSINQYIVAGVKRWSGGNQANSVVQLTDAGGAGTYNTTLNNCHVGLGGMHALNVPATGGIVTVNGGVFAHTGKDGIRISGNEVFLNGTETDRIRVFRYNNDPIGGHGVEVETNTGSVEMTYVDSGLGNEGSNSFAFRNQSNSTVSLCRAVGSDALLINATVFIQQGATLSATDCTFVGLDNPDPGQPDSRSPLQIPGGFFGTASYTDCIFTSELNGSILFDDDGTGAAPSAAFTNCAIPSDGVTSESLDTVSPISGTGVPVLTANVAVSPLYLLTGDDYDWSDNQGAGDLANGAGNRNVLRPSNAAYATAASDGGALTGGAGPAAAGISADLWMLQ